MADFLHELGALRSVSPNTVRAYSSDLAGLCDWLAGRGLGNWQSVRRAQLQAWVAEGARRGLSARTLARRLASVRAFLRHARERGALESDPAAGLRAPKQGRTLPKDMTVEAVEGLMSAAASRLGSAAPPAARGSLGWPEARGRRGRAGQQATGGPQARGADWLRSRDLAMLELLYSSGLRLAELVGMDLDSLDLHNRMARVLGKGGKEREVPVGGKAAEALRAWLRLRGQLAAAGETALFVSKRGGRLGARSVQLRLRQTAQLAGLGAVHPHQLRHSFASHMLQSSGNLRAVQELLGHAKIATTQIYTRLDWNQLAKVYDAAHPRARANAQQGRRLPPGQGRA